MSAVQLLLDHLARTAGRPAWPPAESGVHVVTVDGEVVVNLVEDVDACQVYFLSSPGWSAGPSMPAPAKCDEGRDEDDCEAIRAPGGTGLVILSSKVDRGALDVVCFGETLARHARQWRRWRDVLADAAAAEVHS